jgi:ABC-type branched-subunit amino acid transport system substrate-binding protein
VAPFDLYAAAATEVMLDALARSDGTRASVTRALATTRLANSIAGPLAFNRYGEPVPSPIRVLRAVRPVPKSPFVYNGNAGGEVEDVLTPPARLVATPAAP